jgi:predicted DNA-binding transcriptional regulator AlpA
MQNKAVATLLDTGFVRLSTILLFVPVGKSSWWAGVKNGRYPKPVKLGPRTTAWKTSDILALIEQLSVNASGGAQ